MTGGTAGGALGGADVRGANLSEARISAAQLAQARADSSPQLDSAILVPQRRDERLPWCRELEVR